MRPLIIITVGYITGIIWGLYLNISIVLIFFILILVMFLIKKEILIKYKNIIIAFIIFAIISNMHISYLENKYENLYKDNEEVTIIGTVISEKEETTYKNRYTIKVDMVSGDNKYKGTYLIIYANKNEELKYGEQIYFVGNFTFADEATNYKGFDYREYLKTKNIYGIVTVGQEIKVIKENNLLRIFLIANKVKLNMKENLNQMLGDHASLIIGILLGDTSEISDETIDDFKTSNMYHILAVSGTHVRIYCNRYNLCFK